MKKMHSARSVVAIVKTTPETIETSYRSLISLIGGLDTILSPFDIVLLKPNWVTDAHYETGAITHPTLIRACIRHLLEIGAKKVLVADSSFVGADTQRVIENSGLLDLASRRVEFLDFKKQSYTTVTIPNAMQYRRIQLPQVALECDAIINIPVMKTHDCLPVTLGLKNMKGLLRDTDKRRLHKVGLVEGLIDLNRVMLPNLTIMDGIIGMEGNGPIEGTPVGHNLLIASTDPLAAEVVAIRAMGLDPMNIPYIKMATEAGFGENVMENIHIVGEPLHEVVKTYKLCENRLKDMEKNNIVLFDKNACSACRHTLNSYFAEKENEIYRNVKDIWFYAGGKEIDQDNNVSCRKSIGLGNCLQTCKNQFDYFVPGCPPSKFALKQVLYKLINEKNEEAEK